MSALKEIKLNLKYCVLKVEQQWNDRSCCW